MLGIDTNILLYAVAKQSPFHAKALAFIQEVQSNQEVVIAEPVLVELYLLLRNKAVVGKPLSASKAVAVVERFRGNPSWTLVESAPVMDRVWEKAGKRGFARRRIFDVRLAYILQHHGVTRIATSNVKDFKDLGFADIVNPIV